MLGTDIIEVSRIKKLVDGDLRDNFLNKVFTKLEIEYCHNNDGSYRYPSLAARFTAKEAVMKVLGNGMNKIDWKDIEVNKLDSGKPFIKLYGKAKEIAKTQKVTTIEVSLSHTDNYATAVALAK